jgi:hypothetical protein
VQQNCKPKVRRGTADFCVFLKKTSIFMTIVQVCPRKMRAAGDQQQQEVMFINFFEVLSLEGTHSFPHFLISTSDSK